ncbi:hypothetical protein A7K94_0200685 [Modestobacter sp. VKM Ac-2676]|nr:hypothetical protein A7K94_0200685 [Modestobacter sp. VKM Ac-2676]
MAVGAVAPAGSPCRCSGSSRSRSRPWGCSRPSSSPWPRARRYGVVHESLTTRGDLTGVRQAGVPIAALACSGLLIGVLSLVFVVFR